MNGGDFSSIDWADVAISTAVGTIAPGALSAGTKIFRSFKAGRNITNQLGRVKAVSRQQKLQGRINNHGRIVREQLATQGAWQGGKFIAKQGLDYPNQGK